MSQRTFASPRKALPLGLLAAALSLAAAHAAAADGPEAPAAVVRAREVAFAKTMADRDLAAFSSFVAEEAVFFAGPKALRGRQAVVEGWKAFFDGKDAPFSWMPDRVEVLDSGALAVTSGPVLDPKGQRVGTFNSTWRREADGVWRVVIDIGCPPCR